MGRGGGGSKAVWEFSKKTSSLENPVTPKQGWGLISASGELVLVETDSEILRLTEDLQNGGLQKKGVQKISLIVKLLAFGSELGVHYPYRRGIFLFTLPALTIEPEHSW